MDIGSDFKEPEFKSERTIKTDVESKWQGEGVGARVRRSIGRSELRNLGEQRIPQTPSHCTSSLLHARCADPFLMLDEFSVGKPAGFPDHPHRGFETVSQA